MLSLRYLHRKITNLGSPWGVHTQEFHSVEAIAMLEKGGAFFGLGLEYATKQSNIILH